MEWGVCAKDCISWFLKLYFSDMKFPVEMKNILVQGKEGVFMFCHGHEW